MNLPGHMLATFILFLVLAKVYSQPEGVCPSSLSSQDIECNSNKRGNVSLSILESDWINVNKLFFIETSGKDDNCYLFWHESILKTTKHFLSKTNFTSSDLGFAIKGNTEVLILTLKMFHECG